MMFGLTGVLAQQGIQDLVNPRYCPQNTTGFYTINATINPQQDLTNYCEHTREICVTETVIDKTNIQIPTFLPTDSALWLDADDSSTITTVSGAVSEWRDKSGNLRHATQAMAGNRPLLVTGGLNGTDVVRFDGSDWLDCTTNLTLTAQHLFIVFKYNTSSGSFVRPFTYSDAGFDYNNTGHYIPIVENNNNSILYSYFSGQFQSGLSMTNGEIVMWENLHTGSQVSNYKNGRAMSSVVSNNTLNKTFTRYRIAGAIDDTTTNNLDGDISQIIIFPRVLTQAEREQMEGYLAWSTGLQGNLPVGHPYKDSYTGVTVNEVTTCTDFYDFAQAP